MDSLIIRPILPADLAAIAEIYNDEIATGTATFDTEPRSVEDIRAWLLNRGKQFPSLVGVLGDQVIGFSALYPWSPRKAYDITAENTVYLRKDRRGHGWGEALLRAALDAGREAGIHSVLARISAGNDASEKLHERLGFVKVGTMKEVGRKFDRLLDVHLMQLVFK
jgi:phosphinothricin acetyltransferase